MKFPIYRIPGQPIDQYPEREPVFPCWLWSKETTDERWEHFQSWDNSRRPHFFGWSHWSAASVLNPPCNAPQPPEESPSETTLFKDLDEAVAWHKNTFYAASQPPAVEPWIIDAIHDAVADLHQGADHWTYDQMFARLLLLARIIAQHAPDAPDTRRVNHMERLWRAQGGKGHHLCGRFVYYAGDGSFRQSIDAAMRNDNSTNKI